MIENKVANSGLKTIDLEKILPKESDLVAFDLKDFLFRGLILKEKDFREAIAQHNWQQYLGKGVAIFCSTDAIIPMWAYMLVSAALGNIATYFIFGTLPQLQAAWVRHNISTKIDIAQFANKKVIIKGCGNKPIPAEAYIEATRLLQPIVQSLMFGEACSTVPILKKSV